MDRKIDSAKEGVLISESITVPCAVGLFRKKILFPKSLMKHLSSEEVKAVIVHEQGHLFWHDAVCRLGGQFLSLLFWWIPMKNWRRHIENMQEEACDTLCKQPIELASAILKTAQFQAKMNESVAITIL